MNHRTNGLKISRTGARSFADAAKVRGKRISRRGVLTLGLVVMGMLFAISATAGGHKGHRSGGGSSDWVERHAEELGIDDATLAEITQIVDSSREQGEAIHEEHRAARDAMHDLLEQDDPNFDAVMRQAEVIGEIDIRKHKHRIATMLEIRAKLTPEQRNQLRELKGERRERHDGKHRRHDRKGCERREGRGEASPEAL